MALHRSFPPLLGRQWIIVNPLAKTPSVIHALKSVGKTTTWVWWFFYWHHHIHHIGDAGYDF